MGHDNLGLNRLLGIVRFRGSWTGRCWTGLVSPEVYGLVKKKWIFDWTVYGLERLVVYVGTCGICTEWSGRYMDVSFSEMNLYRDK